ncbi:MAG: TetR family transcriptional regulator [Bacteroidetes bacterium]|nr:TetR family transcriptional regulator [Bacteroidota bacterium]
MQKQKPEIEAIILEKAELEFYQFGFEKASLRRIIKAAGISIGNFYNYFGSKSDLFNRIVKDEYVGFSKFLNNHETVENPLEIIQSLNADNIKEIIGGVIRRIMPEFNRRFVILAEADKASGYEHARQQILDSITEHLNEHYTAMNRVQNKEFTKLIATQFLDGMLSIIKTNIDNKEKRNELLSDFFQFYFSGVMGLIGYKF